VVTRNSAIDVLLAVTCAPITRTIRGIRSEVRIGRREGLSATSVINCDNLVTVPKEWLDRERLGRLSRAKRVQLDQALRYTLDIQY
jgi:mRNA interferase MazF